MSLEALTAQSDTIKAGNTMLSKLLLFMLFSICLNPNNLVAATVSAYEEEINLPVCNESDSNVLFIRTKDDWKRINDTKHNVFCVLPGDYSAAGVIDLRASGTENSKRWIRWYDPDNPNDKTTHPVDMEHSKQAVVRQIFVGGINEPSAASYWIIDRLVIRGSVGANQIANNSSKNIFNRIVIEEGRSAYFVFNDSNNNVLQNSVLRNAKMVPGSDRCLVYFSQNLNDRVVNNELANPAGGGCVQQGPSSLSGNVIYGNDCYATSERYTDCNGNLDPSGECAASEEGIVIKGPANSSNTLLIANNRIWGFRKCDTKLAGTGSPGHAINIGSGNQGVSNVIIEGNLIYDSPSGIYLADKVRDIQIKDNIIYDINRGDSKAISNTYGKTITINGNTIINCKHWYIGSYLNENLSLQRNVLIDCPNVGILNELPTTATVKDNYMYNSKILDSINTHSEYVFSSATDSKNIDYCFAIKRLTSNSTKCIPFAQETSSSPHYKNLIAAPKNLKVGTSP